MKCWWWKGTCLGVIVGLIWSQDTSPEVTWSFEHFSMSITERQSFKNVQYIILLLKDYF